VEWLNSIYLGCFIFGLVFTIISFLIGGLGHLGNFHLGTDGAHADLGGHASHVGHGPDGSHGDSATDPMGLPFFNLTALIVFLTWFGGTGFILTALRLEPILTLPLAFVGGAAGYLAILLFLSKVLFGSQTPLMTEEAYKLNGVVGRVSSVIQPGGVGEVIFNQAGARRFIAARSMDGSLINRDTQVVFLGVENGIALVNDLDKMLEDSDLAGLDSPEIEKGRAFEPLKSPEKSNP
jgi:membrane protein implicated in regulation of membrane protease activity